MRYFLGGDLGGSKSHLLIADETGRAVGFAVGTGANHEMVGYGVVTNVVRDLLATALPGAGIQAGAIVGAGMGISGYDWQSERSDELSALACRPRGVPGRGGERRRGGPARGRPRGLGEGSSPGPAATAGASTAASARPRPGPRVPGGGICRRRSPGPARRLGRRTRGDRRGPETGLTRAFMDYTGTRDADDFLEAFCERRVEVPASAAPLVFRVRVDG